MLDLSPYRLTTVGLSAPNLVRPVFDIQNFKRVLPREVQPFIENLVRVFILVGVIASSVT